jgi:hypothetical protein
MRNTARLAVRLQIIHYLMHARGKFSRLPVALILPGAYNGRGHAYLEIYIPPIGINHLPGIIAFAGMRRHLLIL